MFENTTQSRDKAESAFAKPQPQFLARSRIVAQRAEIEPAREAKTARLREMRIEKEAADLEAAAKAPPAKPRRSRARQA